MVTVKCANCGFETDFDITEPYIIEWNCPRCGLLSREESINGKKRRMKHDEILEVIDRERKKWKVAL